MKIGTWILTISLAATAWAQSPAPKPQPTTKPQAAPAQQTTPKPQTSTQSAAKPAVSPEKSAAAAPKSAAPAVKSEKASKVKKHASASSKAAAKPEAAKSATQTANQSATKPADKAGKQGKEAQASPDKTVAKVTVHKGKRDPFVSPVKERKFALCTVGGKRCLFIEDLNLVGIIEASNGTVAVVANGRHTYFLREHDPLADGEVMRITGDTITLRQRTTDLFGHPVEREVTRKIGMPAV